MVDPVRGDVSSFSAFPFENSNRLMFPGPNTGHKLKRPSDRSTVINFSPTISNGSSSFSKIFAILFLGAIGGIALVKYGPTPAAMRSYVLGKLGLSFPGIQRVRDVVSSLNPFAQMNSKEQTAGASQAQDANPPSSADQQPRQYTVDVQDQRDFPSFEGYLNVHQNGTLDYSGRAYGTSGGVSSW